MKTIQYLSFLEKKIQQKERESDIETRGLTERQIQILEQFYYTNSTKQFPKVFRELLSLLGSSCEFFNVGIDLNEVDFDSTDISLLLKGQIQFKTYYHSKLTQLHFPFKKYWVLTIPYRCDDYIYFIDLNENHDDPIVYFFNDYKFNKGYENYIEYADLSIRQYKIRLREFIDYKVKALVHRPVEEFENLLTYGEFDYKIKDTYDLNHILHLAIDNGESKVVEYILNDLVEVNKTDTLLSAFQSYEFRIADLLLKTDVDVEKIGRSIFKILALKNKIELIVKYESMGFQPFWTNVLDIAIEVKATRIIPYLLEKGQRLLSNKSLLFSEVVSLGDLKILKNFVLKHPDLIKSIHQKNGNSYECLYIINAAVRSNQVEILEYILIQLPIVSAYQAYIPLYALEYSRLKITKWYFRQEKWNNAYLSPMGIQPYWNVEISSEIILYYCENDLLKYLDMKAMLIALCKFGKEPNFIKKIVEFIQSIVPSNTWVVPILYKHCTAETSIHLKQVLPRFQIFFNECLENSERKTERRIQGKEYSRLKPIEKVGSFSEWIKQFSLIYVDDLEKYDTENTTLGKEEYAFLKDLNAVFYYLNSTTRSKNKARLIRTELIKVLLYKLTDLLNGFRNLQREGVELHLFSKVDSVKEIKNRVFDELLTQALNKCPEICSFLIYNHRYKDVRIHELHAQLFKKREKEILKQILRRNFKETTLISYQLSFVEEHKSQKISSGLLKLTESHHEFQIQRVLLELYPEYIPLFRYKFSFYSHPKYYENLPQKDAFQILKEHKEIIKDEHLKLFSKLLENSDPVTSFHSENVSYYNAILAYSIVQHQFKIAQCICSYFYSVYGKYFDWINLNDYKDDLDFWFGLNENDLCYILSDDQKQFICKQGIIWGEDEYCVSDEKKNIIPFNRSNSESEEFWILEHINHKTTIKDVELLLKDCLKSDLNNILYALLIKCDSVGNKALIIDLLEHFPALNLVSITLLSHLKNEEITKSLLALYPNIKVDSYCFLAAIRNNNSILLTHCINHKIIPNLENALILADEHGHLNMFKILLNMGANVHAKDSYILKYCKTDVIFKHLLSSYSFVNRVIKTVFLMECTLGRASRVILLKPYKEFYTLEVDLALLVALNQKKYKLAQVLVTDFKGNINAYYGAMNVFCERNRYLNYYSQKYIFLQEVKSYLPTFIQTYIVRNKLRKVEEFIHLNK